MKAKKDVDGLIKALGYMKDADIRLATIQALWEIDDPRVVESLIATLQDEDRRVREEAAIWLAKICDTRGVEALVQLRDHAVRELLLTNGYFDIAGKITIESVQCAACGIELLSLTEAHEKFAQNKLGNSGTAMMSMETFIQMSSDRDAIGVTCVSCGHSFCTTCMQKHGKPHTISGGLACLDCGCRMKEFTRN
jgi:hypothetical protein